MQKSFLPKMSVPVERKLHAAAPAQGEGGGPVAPSMSWAQRSRCYDSCFRNNGWDPSPGSGYMMCMDGCERA